MSTALDGSGVEADDAPVRVHMEISRHRPYRLVPQSQGTPGSFPAQSDDVPPTVVAGIGNDVLEGMVDCEDSAEDVQGLQRHRVDFVSQHSSGSPQSVQDVSFDEDASSANGIEEYDIASDEHGAYSEEDTESLMGDGASAVSIDDIQVLFTEPDVEVREPRVTCVEIRAAFEFHDTVDLRATFSRRACMMKTLPHFLHGPFRNALHTPRRKQFARARPIRAEDGNCFK